MTFKIKILQFYMTKVNPKKKKKKKISKKKKKKISKQTKSHISFWYIFKSDIISLFIEKKLKYLNDFPIQSSSVLWLKPKQWK